MNSPEKIPRILDERMKANVRSGFDRLRASFPNFRARSSQNHMVAAVARALGNPRGVGIIEAPTGTGKSLAYMLAAVPIALDAGLKLVISTATVALQEQVANRDIPAFLKACGIEAKVSLAKGRQRWACPRNMSELVATNGPIQDDLLGEFGQAGWTRPPKANEAQTVAELAEALIDEKWNGDVDNPPVDIPSELKPLITTSAGACSGRRCMFFGSCPAMRAREELKEADIIVANHDLVLRSLIHHEQGGEQNFLSDPTQTLYVFDEGHTLSAKSIDAGAAMVHLPSALNRLPKMKPVTASVFRLLGETEVAGKRLDQVHEWLGSLAEVTDTIRNYIQLQWQPNPSDYSPHWRAPHGRVPDDWRELAHSARLFAGILVNWVELARDNLRKAELSDAMLDKISRELGGMSEHLSAYHELWSQWAEADDHGAPIARWVSLGADMGLVCNASRVSAASFLTKNLWEAAEGVVMTSATLSSGGNFNLLAEACGIPETAEYSALSSPFDLPGQAILSVPKFPVLPNSPQHPEAIAEWLKSHLDWNAGSLVLFTSKRKMEAVAALLPESFRASVRVQGEKSKQIILDGHADAIKQGRGSVLFGMLSFGEGLDMPGKLLTEVVVTQLPFSVPTDPVGATLAEWYETTGRNPFVEISVPDALRTLTQFCGRLIRTETDQGKITVLDRRLVQKQYGKTILKGLPPFQRKIEH